MTTLYNLARAVTATKGTGSVVEGAAVTGFLTWELAGVPDAAVVSYGLQDLDVSGNITQSEVGIGTWTTATKTLARTTVIKSTNSDAKINLAGAGNAEMYITALAGDVGMVTVSDAAADTTTWPLLALSQTGSLLTPSTDAGLTYNASTNALTAAAFVGALTGNADTATGLSVTAGKTLTVSNSLTITATDGATIAAGGGIVSGTYTPTLTNVTNIAASVLNQDFIYLRIGTSVLVCGSVQIDVTTAGVSSALGISLPVASNFGTTYDLNGTASCPGEYGGAVISSSVNDRAEVYITPISNANLYWRIVFAYRII
jgi:hypothetical protein